MPDSPASISRYQIVEQLAISDAGAVYKAFDPMIERMVAVKVFSAGRDGATIDSGVKDTFYREMQRAGTLNHPAIAMLFDVGEAQQGLFAAAEFVDGASLATGIPLDLDVRARIALIGQVADALEYAQEMGVPHLNLKPSSVLVRSDLTVKVSGFGIAHILTALGRVTGARRQWVSKYAAPERLAGADGDARSDVYGLAMLTREFLSGTSMDETAGPDGSTTPADLALVCPPSLAALGFTEDAWKDTFGRALSLHPGDRFPTTTAFLAAVTRVLGVTRPMTPRVWAASSRVILGDAFADPAKWSDTVSTDGGAVAASPRMAGDEEPATWTRSSVSTPAQRLRAEPDEPADPDTTALAARVELQALAPAEPAVPGEPAAPAPVAAPASPQATVQRRGAPRAAALFLGLCAGAAAVALVWFFVPGIRDLVSPPQDQQSAAGTESGATEAAAATSPSEQTPATPTVASTPAPEIVAVPPVESAVPAPAAPGATLGLLRIATNPPGAQVTIDGKPRGVTPLRLRNLSLSAHVVQIALEGYAPETPRIVLTPGRATQTLEITLRPLAIEPVEAQLSIETMPTGASIFVDEESAGRTPLSLSKIRAGRHTVRAEREGFESAARDIDLRAGEAGSLTIQLTPLPSISSAPIEFDRVQVKPQQTAGPASPGYPRAARAARLTGFVVATWVVDEKGTVGAVTVLEASAGIFETELRNWLQEVRYAPGQQAGQPVKVIVKRRFSFALGREEQ